MISVTRLDGTTVLVNVDQIESIEQTPDTVVSLMNGHKFIAKETPEELVERIVKFKHWIESPRTQTPTAAQPSEEGSEPRRG